MSDGYTVLRAPNRRLAKAVRGDGTILPYDKTYLYDLFPVELSTLPDLEALLHRLLLRTDCCIVRGDIADPERTRGVRRLLHRDDDTGDEPTLREVPRRLLALDIDGLPRPASVPPEDLLGCGAAARAQLPEAFRSAKTIVQATGSHGLKPGLRLRLCFELDRSVCGAQAKYWFRDAPVDLRLFGANQLIYTAAPVFLPGAYDPLPERLAVLPGESVVAVPPDSMLRPPPRKINNFKRRENTDNRAIAGLLRVVARASEGERNSSLYWATRRMAERGIAPSKAAALLEQAAAEAGLPAAEAAATVRSGLAHAGE